MIYMSVDTIFNFVNFGIRIALIGYIVKKYIIGYIISGMHREAVATQNLLDHQKSIKNDCNQALAHLESQELFYEQAQHNFKVWQKAIESEHRIQIQKQEENQKKIELLRDKKQRHLEFCTMLQQQVPEIVAQVQQKLADDYYKNPDQGKKYIDNILQALDE